MPRPAPRHTPSAIAVGNDGRLTIHKVPEGALVTTMWLVVGPLGQSIAGIVALGSAAGTVWPDLGHGLGMAGLAYGVLVWGFAMYWLAMAVALTVRAARKHLPFNLSWWAFTFPVGVLTAGTDALFLQTQAHIFGIVSLLLLTLLATMWSLVALKTLRGAPHRRKWARRSELAHFNPRSRLTQSNEGRSLVRALYQCLRADRWRERARASRRIGREKRA